MEAIPILFSRKRLLRAVRTCGMAMALLVVALWTWILVTGEPIDLRVTHRCVFGSNGFAVRGLCDSDERVSIAWDALGTNPHWKSIAGSLSIQVPVAPLFVAGIMSWVVAAAYLRSISKVQRGSTARD